MLASMRPLGIMIFTIVSDVRSMTFAQCTSLSEVGEIVQAQDPEHSTSNKSCFAGVKTHPCTMRCLSLCDAIVLPSFCFPYFLLVPLQFTLQLSKPTVPEPVIQVPTACNLPIGTL